jgi:dTDP-4-dehydrorhamnose reductase
MAERRALVIGASGQVGRNVARAFAARGWEVVGTGNTRAGGGLRPLDLLDRRALRPLVEEVRPQVCVLSAGMTHVDGCEAAPERARATNVVAPTLIAEACRDAGAQLVYLSTEYVFDGLAGPYGEGDRPRPISVYGATKLEGEERVLSIHPENLSVRTTVVYGYHPADKNFVMQLIGKLEAGERMRVPADQYSSPTYAPDLAEAIASLVGKVSGILNVVGPEIVGRYELARQAARVLGLDDRLLDPVTTAELRQAAPRPLRAGLTIGRLRSLGVEMRGVGAGLAALALERSRHGWSEGSR